MSQKQMRLNYQKADLLGIACPNCKKDHSGVIDSRKVGNTVWRRRDCLECGLRYTTHEISREELDLYVKQKLAEMSEDGAFVPRDRLVKLLELERAVLNIAADYVNTDENK